MPDSNRRWLVAVATAAGVLVPAALSMACVGVASLVVNGSATVEPGDTVNVTGRSFAEGVPVHIRLDSLTGPVLVTVPGPSSTMNSAFTVDVPLPSDLSDGSHILLAGQDHHNMNVGQPARAVIYVNAAPAPRPRPAVRPQGLVSSAGPSGVTLALIAVAVAAGGLLLAGVGSRMAARRRLA